ncbi:hypothetical protein COX18_03100 [Candidatus Desantisbacteria bacterium CG23_combo_of_CG06-09_8_20_14_all_40_23]|uniref:Uncharacterized protein n=1 Tax=Candidatus Desantisbacteria bacterium CG23_combo_of_CG06-09_8_20_14_all_40_23 TaxID=1974550 RepID=A0A2H0A7V3_9BACT|nr:MAG: hypothetical protein COX18_03100 [Candidatus Desantisbacteria bacterium CG23_combo_of_CG06-09_8_20_14_all_40_23]
MYLMFIMFRLQTAFIIFMSRQGIMLETGATRIIIRFRLMQNHLIFLSSSRVATLIQANGMLLMSHPLHGIHLATMSLVLQDIVIG